MKKIIIGVILLIIALFVLSWITIIKSWTIWLVYNLWAIKSTLSEWVHWKNIITNSIVKVDIKTNKLEINSSSASKDLQIVESVIALNYSVDSSKVMKLYRDIGPDYSSRIIEPSIQESIKSATAKFTAEELITKREEIKQIITSNIKQKLSINWLVVSDVNIVNFEFSKSFNDSIENKVKAEQDALAQKNKLEQVKYEAQQTIEQAKAQAESIRIQAEAIASQWWENYVKTKWIEKWNWILPTTSLWEGSNILYNLNNK